MPVREVLSIVTFAIAIGGCAARPAANGAQGESAASATGGSFTGTFAPLGGPLAGTIRLDPRDGASVSARITLRYAPPDEELPWDLAEGRCGSENRPLAFGASYRPVPTRSDGTAEMVATVEVTLAGGGVYHARLYRTRQAVVRQQPIACAELIESG